MNNLIFSLAATLAAPVYSTRGQEIGRLADVICNKDTGRVTYFLVSVDPPDANINSRAPRYAVHHSYFYFAQGERQLTYSPKLGNEEQYFFVELPADYDGDDVQTITEFNAYLLVHANVGGHRTDND